MPPSIYLASCSPRRRELLTQIGVPHTVLAVEVEECPRPGEPAADYVLRVARDKALAGWNAPARLDDRPVLSADTAVVIDGDILGKPHVRDEALRMLARLSGREHAVYSGVAVVRGEAVAQRLNLSRVVFRAIDEAERAAYWASGEPADKAGGYAIQGLGAAFVASLQGSYSGVMGLPLFETVELLREFGVDVLGDYKQNQ